MVKSQKMSENEIGYRGSKSENGLKKIINSVKEQRVDGSIIKIFNLNVKVYSMEKLISEYL